MLKEIQFENFKCWKQAKVKCAPITGFFGQNSSGKSSIFQFLLMLKQTKESAVRTGSLNLGKDNDSLVWLGAGTDILHLHKENVPIRWRLKLELDEELEIEKEFVTSDQFSGGINFPEARGKQIEVSGESRYHQRGFVGTGLSYYIGAYQFELCLKKNSAFENLSSQTSFEQLVKDKKIEFVLRYHLNSDKKHVFPFKKNPGRPWPLHGPVRSYAFPDKVRSYFQHAGFLADFELAYETQMDEIFYLGPLRVAPERVYSWSKSEVDSLATGVGKKGENTIAAIIDATHEEMADQETNRERDASIQERIASWLKRMKLIEEFRMEEISAEQSLWNVRVKKSKSAIEVSLPDVGIGVSQVLPVITLLETAPRGSTVLLEQPELHLHPLAQTELADVIIHAATERKVQVLLESHSEHLLLRFQRRFAEEALPKTDFKLYFVNQDDNESKLETLQLDDFGRITNWPDNFMGDAFNETADAVEARLEKMIEDKNKKRELN